MGLEIFEESAQANMGISEDVREKRTRRVQDKKGKRSGTEDKVRRMHEVDGGKDKVRQGLIHPVSQIVMYSGEGISESSLRVAPRNDKGSL